MPTPKIDYLLLADAVRFYQNGGYEYVEVPWAVEESFIRATLPNHLPFMELGQVSGSRDGTLDQVYGGENALVGSAEQGFLALALPPGRYVGVTPCFRLEGHNDLFHQDMFMKVELFDNTETPSVKSLLEKAKSFMSLHANGRIEERVVHDPNAEHTIDLVMAGIEVGSYGARTHPDFGTWAFGTGLALPRYSVVNALSRVL